MAEEMRSSESEGGDDVLGKLEASLAELRAAASASPEPESWTKRAFGSASTSSHQNEFNVALIGALQETLKLLRTVAANQETQGTHVEKLAWEMSEVRALSENLDAFRERTDRLEAELRAATRNVKGLQERAAAFESELAEALEKFSGQERKLSEETRERAEQVRNEIRERVEQLGNEMRERIQHVLDEQRVSIRQLSLQASEEAILADRARKAVELKLDALAGRSGPPPA